MPAFVDLTGKRFGYLLVLDVYSRRNGPIKWLCECDCGRYGAFNGSSMKYGLTKSCGCEHQRMLIRRNTKHNNSKKIEYRKWKAMITRCYCEKYPGYLNYGGRGITVCDRWLESFENFYEDMGDCPERMELDRINNDKGYFKENCKWSTNLEQSRNRRTNHNIEYNGEIKCITDWAVFLTCDVNEIKRNLKRGLSFDQVVNKFQLRQKRRQ